MQKYNRFLELAEKIAKEEIEATKKGKRSKASAKRIRVMLNEAKKIITEAKRDLLPKNASEKPIFVEENPTQKSIFPEYDFPQYVLKGVE